MKRTQYKVQTSNNINRQGSFKRVFEDENGKRYIRENGQYICIDGKPLENHVCWLP